MTLTQLNKKLDKALRDYIKKRKHILTGALYRSVIFKCEFKDDLKLKFNSMYYVKFLEHGEFINDFYNLTSTNEIIKDFIVSRMEDEL